MRVLSSYWGLLVADSLKYAKCSQISAKSTSLLCPTVGSCVMLGTAVCTVLFCLFFWGNMGLCVEAHITSNFQVQGWMESEGWIESAFPHQTSLLKSVGQLDGVGLPFSSTGNRAGCSKLLLAEREIDWAKSPDKCIKLRVKVLMWWRI